MTKLLRIKQGADKHLRDRGYYTESWSDEVDTIDGLIGVKSEDFTDASDYPHIGINIINTNIEVGISPEFVEEVAL